MRIEISVPRPLLTLIVAGALVGGMIWLRTGGEAQALPQAADTGGDPLGDRALLAQAEDGVRRAQAEQIIRDRTEEILRAHLASLQAASSELGPDASPEQIAAIREETLRIVALTKDRTKAEEQILAYFRQLWDAEGRAAELGRSMTSTATATLRLPQWPADPTRGLTAGFRSPSYFAFYKFHHDGLDIRLPQESAVRAAADGVVTEVVDNGYGFNSVTIAHEQLGPVTTMVGHVTRSVVRPGDRVSAGQYIADSGGMPGTLGAGFRTTGPHLHFEVRVKGVPVDPLDYLPDAGVVPES